MPDMTDQQYAEHLCALHGEACDQTKAAKIIGCSTRLIRDALQDGRLESACGGTRVSVRSIAAYIRRRPQIDYNTRLERRRARDGTYCRFSV